MKIIAHGKMVGSPEIHGDCVSCYCKIAFVPDEAKLVYDGRDGNYYQIKCPECPGYINVSVRVAEHAQRRSE